MKNQITAETLSPITHNQIPVITTELLARLYGTDTNNIKVNHARNVDRFVSGKHYFKLEGAELKNFKDKVTQSNLVASRAKHLILWTERGAARHAKILETDQAWEVFEKLEDCYFAQKPGDPISNPNIPFPEELRFVVTMSVNGVTNIEPLSKDIYVGKVEHLLSGLRERGWVVISRDMLVEKISTL